MIPNKFEFHTFTFVMSLLMSGVVSFVLLTLSEVLVNWPKVWSVAT